MEEKHVANHGVGMNSIKIEAYQSAGLVLHTRRLSNLVAQSADVEEVTCLATAAILMAVAAIEALLSEAAYLKKPELYATNAFQYGGVPVKFEKLMGEKLKVMCPDADELWGHRLALSHAEPDHRRTRFVGQRINAAGACWAAKTVEKLAVKIWGAEMPNWFAETTGLSPEGQHSTQGK